MVKLEINDILKLMSERSPCFNEKEQKTRDVKELTTSDYVKDILRVRLPSEPDYIHDYRVENFRPIIKAHFSKVCNVLSRASNSEDFIVSFPEAPMQLTDYTPEAYIEDDVKLKKWAFEIFLPWSIQNPNGVVVVLPKYLQTDTQEFPEPYPFLVENKDIYHAKPGKYLVYVNQWATLGLAKVFTVIDGYSVRIFENKKDSLALIQEYAHGFGVPPYVDAGNVIASMYPEIVYESDIAGAIPYWKEALLLNSDLQGANKQHAWPEKWRYGQNCNDCEGTGSRHVDGKSETCKTCSGSGVASVYSELLVRPAVTTNMVTEQSAPIPPAGYITKDTASLKYLSDQIEHQIYQGYSAINMELLAQVGANQSGIAKAMDRTELNSFIARVTKHVAHVYRKVSGYILQWRYGYFLNSSLANDFAPIKELMPEIKVSEFFDIRNSEMVQAEIDAARKGGARGGILRELELDYVYAKYSSEPTKLERAKLEVQLDPLPGVNVDDLSTYLAEGLVTRIDAVIHANISAYVDKALWEVPGFSYMDRPKQKEVLEKYAVDTLEKTQRRPNDAETGTNFGAIGRAIAEGAE